LPAIFTAGTSWAGEWSPKARNNNANSKMQADSHGRESGKFLQNRTTNVYAWYSKTSVPL
jgi:hypothetical protein